MQREPSWRRYLTFWRARADRDIDDELRFHLEERIEELVQGGLASDQARKRALEELGDLAAVRDRLGTIDARISRARGRVERGRDLLQDVRYVLRSLRRAPALAVTVVVTLALGLGANAAIFSFVYDVFVRPPAGVTDPGSLRRLYLWQWSTKGPVTHAYFSYLEFLDVRAAVAEVATLAAYAPLIVRLGATEAADTIRSVYTGPDYFALLGVRPELGRFFAEDEARLENAAPVAVISHSLWIRRFGGGSDVLGQTIEIDRRRFVVVGVAPRAFTGVDLDATDVWLPLGTMVIASPTGEPWFRQRAYTVLHALARVSSGAAERRIGAMATTAYRRSVRGSDDVQYGDTLAIVGLGSIVKARGPAAGPQELTISTRLAGVAVVVLLVACANVANLLLARAMRRRREIALRLALGISRARLLRLLLTESLVLALLSSAAALLVALWGSTSLRALLTPEIHWAQTSPDWRLFAFVGASALAVGLATGLPPALQASRAEVGGALKAGARDGTYQRSALRTALVVLQAALSVVLLMGAGLFVRSLYGVRQVDVGYDTDRLLFVFIRMKAEPSAAEDARFAASISALTARVANLPGVERVAIATHPPMSGFALLGMYLPGRDSVPQRKGWAPSATAVSREYFTTTGLRLLRGRAFTSSDRTGAPGVLVVNEAMARGVWRGADAIGQCVRLLKPTNPCSTVIGVVSNGHRGSVVEDTAMQYYLPLDQFDAATWPRRRTLIVRAPPERLGAIAEGARNSLRELMPDAESRLMPMTAMLAPQYRPWRLGATLFSAFGVLALVVAAIGVFSTLAYAVGQRRHEFGVRLALGARGGDVLRLVVSEGLREVAIGVALGAVASLALGRVIAALLYATSPRDPLVLGVVCVVLLLVAVLASAGPAWRAARVDPMEALRAE